jgi:hypothetical protein
MRSRHFRRGNELHGHLLDQHDFLGGYMLLLKQPFEMPDTGDRLRVLQGVDDQLDVEIYDRLVGVLGQPRTGPGRKPSKFDSEKPPKQSARTSHSIIR